jgi:transcriptional regulator with PAS, ATPase and Fis domain
MPDNPAPKKRKPGEVDRFTWRSLFNDSATPVYVLGKNRRLRFANAAWEKLTGLKLADALGMVCSNRRSSSPVAAALAPTPEAQAGRPDRARRAAPTGRGGPPWWDITFAPLSGEGGTVGIVGFVAVAGESERAAARKLPPAVIALRDRHAQQFTPDLFGGPAPVTSRLLGQLRHAAESAAPVWLVGERGSGKETAARVIHHASLRRDRAFVAIDCAGLQPYLVESILFGRGALLESAQVGTLYLKNPAALTRDLQQRLADFFAESEHAAPRLICGSGRTAGGDVAAGVLVPEFHAALAVLELPVPPLRDRIAELPRLVAQMLPGVAIDAAVFEVLAAHPWPANLRELADVVQESAAAAKGATVKAEHLPRELRVRAGLEGGTPRPKLLPLDSILQAVEKRLIQLALMKANNHQTKAAELLDIYRSRLWARLEALGIPVPPQPPKPRKDEAEPP